MKDPNWLEQRKKRIFEIIEIGTPGDTVSRIYDFAGLFAIVLNLVVSLIYTFRELRDSW